jgi:hypothetical protein
MLRESTLILVRLRSGASDIQSGVSVGMSWEMHQVRVPPSYRMNLEHETLSIAPFINVSESPGVVLTNPYLAAW